MSDDESTNKVAVFGMHPVAGVLASFVLGLLSKNKHRFFSTKAESLKWLKEKD